ncbi:hypothetical protein I4U23_023331 [Adineta vaga]|nr:hypothetical protein I4U23_023331 [Adineta vaga]
MSIIQALVYESQLTENSDKYCRQLPCYNHLNRYETLQLNVSINATYTIMINADISICVDIYRDSFNTIFKLQNLVVDHLTMCFKKTKTFNATFNSMTKYILVVSTSFQSDWDKFSIRITGPKWISFFSTRITNNLSYNHAYIVSQIDRNSSSLCFTSCTSYMGYYTAFQLTVSATEEYYIGLKSELTSGVYVYQEKFRPFFPTENQMSNQGTAGLYVLKALTRYILVAYAPNVISSNQISINITGAESISLVPITITDTLSFSTPPQVQYASVLTEENPKWCRQDNCTEPSYYYELIQINVSTSDYYAILSNSSFNVLGYIYENTFDPKQPQNNLLYKDSNADIANEFLIRRIFNISTKYLLVVTTAQPNMVTLFSISVISDHPATLISGKDQ